MSDPFADNTSPAVTTQGLRFEEKHWYVGKIIDQSFGLDWQDVAELVLTVAVEGELSDTRDPKSAILPSPKAEVNIRMRFDPAKIDNIKISVRDLQSLGFKSEDLDLLAEDHKQHVSFVGKEVYVTPTMKEYNGKPNTFWNLRFPLQREHKKITKAQVGKMPARQAYKEAIEAVKADKEAKKSGNSAAF